MNNKTNQSLLPQFIKSSAIIPWVFILPQVILLLINISSFWLIDEEVSQNGLQIAYIIFGFELCLLLLASTVWFFSKARKSIIHWGWNITFLVSHIGYLWYVSTNLLQLIPPNIEPWILNQGSLFLYQFTFIMPGLFYGALRLSCFEMNLKYRSDWGLSLLIAILPPIIFYVLFVGIRGFIRSISWSVPDAIASLFFICLTVTAFMGIIRFIVLSYNGIRTKGYLVQIIFAAIIGLVGPIAGLLLNRTIPFPADFQSQWVYILALVNGLIVLLPSVKKSGGVGYLLFARSLTYPFTLYFFLVFLPFLPVSLPAIFAMGTGFLIIIPVVLFLLHTKKIYDDFRTYKQAKGMALTFLLVFIGLTLLPGYFSFEALRDKSSLNKALQYVYSPDYKHDLHFKGSVKSVKRTLTNLKEFKEGIQLPYLSGFYNKIVFEGMVLPDKKIEYMYKLFTGEEITKNKRKGRWGFGRVRGNWRREGRAPARDRNVEISSIEVTNDYAKDIVISRVKLEMHNTGKSDTAEFFREIYVPQGVLITDFQLKIGEEMVPGQIFEKRTAMWVYHMIRDWTRQDPGILTYRTPTMVNLNIYPFNKDQVRTAEIEFQFPNSFSSAIMFGEESVDLLQTKFEQEANALMVNPESGKNSFVVIPGEKISSLPKTKRKPYLHFIIDFSKDGQMDINNLVDHIHSIAEKYKLDKGKIWAVNFDIESLTPEFVVLNQKSLLRDVLSQAKLPYQGGLDIGHAIKHHLLNYQNIFSDPSYDQYWKYYPLFVVITKNDDLLLSLKDMEFFKYLLPDCNYYLVLNKQGNLEERPLWETNKNTKNGEVIILRAADQLSIIPAGLNEMQVAQFSTNILNKKISVYDSEHDGFIPLDNIRNYLEGSQYANGLDLMFDNYEILVNPAKFDERLPSIVKRSREYGIMVPVTSYVIVERSSQWEILKKKEKQRLRTSKGLEFEEDFDTPAPPLWFLLILLFIWYYLRNKSHIKAQYFRR